MLEAERYQRAKAIFFDACDQPVGERTAFVESACAGDANLCAAVMALLAHDERPMNGISDGMGSSALRGHLERLAGSTDAARESAAPLPERIGKYRILSRLGEGGMGIVYLAEQDSPRRQVALKVIASGAASRQTLRRFEHEAQILGRLHHPGIAAVYEAGMHDGGEGGQPFFAMELVRGRTLLRYCDESRTDVRERLRLFIAICEAVQHAHQQGVIHRDLKPANILVEERDEETKRLRDEVPSNDVSPRMTASSLRLSVSPSLSNAQPKILDFGVARLTNSDVQATTMHTAADQLIGTVAYMSPEQMSGRTDAIDTRSDVFALGVILFELLAGRLPHDVVGKTIPEMIRTLSDSEPSSLSSIDRAFRGDLETIAGKAMERDKSRRYASAGELAADIQRFLDDEPIRARPPTTLYQMRKFARRNRALVIGAAAVFLALVGGIITTAWQARQAIAARDEQIDLRKEADDNAARAARSADKATTVVGVLQDMLGKAIPHADRGRDYSVRQMLDDFAGENGHALNSEPDVRASILGTMGDAYLSLGELTSAGPRLIEAVQIRRELAAGRDDPDLAESIFVLAWWHHDSGDYEAAERFMREGLGMSQRLANGGHTRALARAQVALGDVLMHLHQFDESLALLERAVQSLRDANDLDWLPNALSPLAMTLQEMGRPDDAEAPLREALRLEMAQSGAPSLSAMVTMGNLGVLLLELGQYEECERLLREVLEFSRARLGEEHPRVAKAWNNLGLVLDEINRLDEAEDCFRRAIAIHRAHPEFDSANLASMLQNLGITLANRMRFEDAEIPLRESIDLTLAGRPVAEADLALRRGALGDVLHFAGRREEGLALAEEAFDGLRRLQGENHPSALIAKFRVGRMYISANRLAEAETLLQAAFDAMMVSPGPSNRDTVQVAATLADAFFAQRRYAEAEACLVAVLQPATESIGEGHPATVRVLATLVQAYGRQGKLTQADALVRRHIAWMRTTHDSNDLDMADTIASLGISLHRQSLWSEAEPLLREAESMMRANQTPQPMTAQMTWRLGEAVAKQGRFSDAEPLLLEGWKIIGEEAAIEVAEQRQACAAIVDMYKGWNKPDEATRWAAILEKVGVAESTGHPPATGVKSHFDRN